jgi:hypothetical protein
MLSKKNNTIKNAKNVINNKTKINKTTDKNQSNKALRVIYIIIFCVVFVTIFTLTMSIKFLYLQGNANIEIYKKADNIEFFKNYLKFNESNIYKKVKDRCVKIDDAKNIIIIGKNIKEIENDYFDISIRATDDYAKVSINKLFKDINLNQNQKIDEIYLNEIFDLINDSFKLNLKESEFKTLFNYIKESYLKIRDVENVDNIEEKTKDKEINILNYNIKIKIEENMLCLYIFFV